ncbi:hypothetical protein COCSADRAFT_24414 [Bipolaris sorokiniana ND90Pr]|uniref:Xaa-Pro dipeptidyl-peptidase-like domain-containing protein n=1 Tax=Cochliobolus sativus (strain ND90Pr / ATCC 201652) TaxID=665912 RepID=M2SVF4_COCSN|nr:uncharacterized protein COCSADRAFT_24414 [Bipolaris sorokiniana ND90Pr]EMD66295.1 hypothetical protein COCSADRAFT_24414 [Bipolaris sorokiniana ND90Pr]
MHLPLVQYIPRHDAFATWAIHTSAKAVGKIIAAEHGQENETIVPRTDMCLVKTASLSCSDISSSQNQSPFSLSKPPISQSSHPNSDGHGATKVPAFVAWNPPAKDCCIPKRCLGGPERLEGPDPAEYCPRGFVVVNIDTRGADDSDRDIIIMEKQEDKDSHDVIKELAKIEC